MTKAEKELVIKDLCGRLLYGVKMNIPDIKKDGIFTMVGIDYNDKLIIVKNDKGSLFHISFILNFKPYLRPMSSMTEEEYEQIYIDSREKKDGVDILDALANDMDAIVWLNKYHFDYQDLIQKGLAISTEEFNPYK